MNLTEPRIVLLGASGYTGRLIAHELHRLAMPLLLAGRSPGRIEPLARELGGAEVQIADVTDSASLRALMRRGDVVINCAGPFSTLGEPVVRAAIEAGASYLDTTGEQQFMKQTHDRWNRAAVEAGVVVVNAMAFEYALGCCAATLLASRIGLPLYSLDVVYEWQVGPGGASAGTRRSALDILSHPVLRYERGIWKQDRIGSRRRTITTDGGRKRAINFPAGEVVTLPRHLSVERVGGWLVVGGGAARAAGALSPVLSRLVRLLRPLLERVVSRGPEGPDEAARQESRFSIVVEALPSGGEMRRLTVTGRDPYGLTAVIAAAGARKLLQGHGLAGVIDPAQLIDPGELLEELRQYGVSGFDAS